MSGKKNPWEKDEKGPSGVALGPILWVGLLLIVVIIIAFLFVVFPEHRSVDEDLGLDLVRLVAVLALVSSGLVFARKINFGVVIRDVSIWTALGALIVLGYTYRSELGTVVDRVRGELVPGYAVASDEELVITKNDTGHFFINGVANGKPLRFLVDTGATEVTLSPQAASRIGIDLSALRFNQKFQTANGIGFGATYWLKTLTISSFKFQNVRVSINKARMSESLLGMSFLERLQSYEFRGGRLYLRK